MLDKTSIEIIKGLFNTKSEDMPKISTFGNAPNYTSLNKFQEKLNQNAMAVPSHQSHNLGHLGLVIKNTEYTSINNGTAWEDPPAAANKPKKPSFKNSIQNIFQQIL